MTRPTTTHLTPEFQRKINSFTEEFEKDFGKGSLDNSDKYDILSTGSLDLDMKTGVGGYVVGRLHEIYGPPDVGKSQLCLMACVEAQRKWPTRWVAYIDVENKIDNAFARAHGIDTSRWLLYRPQNAEDVADSTKKFLNNEMFGLVVIDSVGAMIGKAEQEKQADQDTVAIVARIVTRMVKIANSFAIANESVVLIVNQIRADISKFSQGTTLPGGNALKYGTSMQFQERLTKTQPVLATINGERIPVGREIAVVIKRNKMAPKGATAILMLRNVATKDNAVGIDKADEAAVIGPKVGAIKQEGAYYTLPDGVRIHTAAALKAHLAKDPVMVDRIREVALTKTEVYEEEREEEPLPPDVDE
jgi:recombination protein RecA